MSVACDVYTKLLFQRGFGHPLWEPEPTQAGEVLLGDVGYVHDGGFYRLFNAALSSNDPIHQRYGVPDDFEPFTIPDSLRHRRERALEAGPICSKNVTALSVDASVDANPGGFGASSNIRFKLTDEQGAILVLKHQADREVLHPCKDLTQYILRNHASWHQFAQNTFRLDIEADRIVFVTGWVKTGGWALAAATQHARDLEISFGGDFGPAFKASLSVSATQDVAMLWEHRCSPEVVGHTTQASNEETTPPFDQCIFIHYCKIKHRKFLGPKVIKAAAEDGWSNSDVYPEEPEPGRVSVTIEEGGSLESIADSTSSPEIHMVPALSSQGDELVECILDYILDRTDAHTAIASDRDLAFICAGNQLQDYSLPENIPQLLAEVGPSISVVGGVGMLSCHLTPLEEVGDDAPGSGQSPTRSPVVRFDAPPQSRLSLRRSRSLRRLSRSRSRSLSRAFSPFLVGPTAQDVEEESSHSESPKSGTVNVKAQKGKTAREREKSGGRRPTTRSVTRSAAGHMPSQTHSVAGPSSSGSQPARKSGRAPASLKSQSSSSRQARKRTRAASRGGESETNERPAKRLRSRRAS